MKEKNDTNYESKQNEKCMGRKLKIKSFNSGLLTNHVGDRVATSQGSNVSYSLLRLYTSHSRQ